LGFQRTIVGFPLESLAAGDTVWGRRAATPAFMHTIEWVVNTFRQAGLADAAVQTYPVPSSSRSIARAGRRSRPARARPIDRCSATV